MAEFEPAPRRGEIRVVPAHCRRILRACQAWTGLYAILMVLLALGPAARAEQTPARTDLVKSRDENDRNPIHTVVPEYPQQAWFERLEGDVEVCFFVTRGGRPYNIAVRRSDHRIFERVARDAVKNSRFEAIPRPDKVPQVKSCRTFLFRLEPLAASALPEIVKPGLADGFAGDQFVDDVEQRRVAAGKARARLVLAVNDNRRD